MSGDMVSWRDYEGVEGFAGASTADELNDLNKALRAGQSINAPSVAAGEGFPLRIESLERVLKVTTFRMEHIRLFKAISKLTAFNTVEEHNELASYGDQDQGAFIDEGDLPEETDATYERKYAVVKYMGTTRKVTHVMSLVRPAHGNVIAQETVNGTMYLLRQIERALFFADSNLDSLQFDGYERLLLDKAPAANIIDMRGAPLTEDVLIDAALTISDAPNYGIPTNLHLNPKVKADLGKQFFPKGRYDIPTMGQNGMVGLDLRGFTSPAGDIRFEPNVFIDDGGGVPAAAVGDSTKRPASPTISTAATTPVNADSQFTADDAGTYAYRVVAVNRFGQSAAVTVSASLAIAAGDDARFGVTPGAGPDVSYYKVYRGTKNQAAGSERLILRVPNSAGSGEETVVDTNTRLPGCTSGFLFQQNLENMSLKMLAPMIKIPLATVDSSIRWMQLIYLVALLYTPGKNVLFQNIGRSPGFVGQP